MRFRDTNNCIVPSLLGAWHLIYIYTSVYIYMCIDHVNTAGSFVPPPNMLVKARNFAQIPASGAAAASHPVAWMMRQQRAVSDASRSA